MGGHFTLGTGVTTIELLLLRDHIKPDYTFDMENVGDVGAHDEIGIGGQNPLSCSLVRPDF